MSKRWQELTDEFAAVSDDGREFRIVVYTTMLDNRTFDDPDAAPSEGLKSARTAEGYACNRIDDTTWKIVQLDLIVRRVS